MRQIAHKLWIGGQQDFEDLGGDTTGWWVVHAARDPWHRQALGYTGRSAPSDHPEYLVARRGNRLLLNLVDAPDPKYVSRKCIDAAIAFIDEAREAISDPDNPNAVLICCNKGQSRAPTIGMLYVAPRLPSNLDAALTFYRSDYYPDFEPSEGMLGFARIFWRFYHNRGRAQDDQRPTALDMAEEIWQRLCETMKTDPALARDQLIKSLVQAFSAAAEKQERSHGQGHGPGTD